MPAKSLFQQHTPVEIYNLKRRIIHVKRDDLFGLPPAPPLGKLRGMRLILNRWYAAGIRTVGCWDTRVSSLGWGLAACCTEFPGLRCIVSYPTKAGCTEPEAVRRAALLGAEIHPVPGARITISFARARENVVKLGGTMLPFGLDCIEAVEGVSCEASQIAPEFVRGGTLVVTCGSGITLAGLLKGLPALPKQILGISSGRSQKSIASCLRRHVGKIPSCVELVGPVSPYSQAARTWSPFPAHPHYDLKAWAYLQKVLSSCNDPILFWNIGA